MGHQGRVQQTFGVVLAVFAVDMAFGLDRAVQTLIVDRVPYVQRLTFLKETDAVRQQLEQQAP
ncbi:hypothetical protein [Deinococcus oregonensis]